MKTKSITEVSTGISATKESFQLSHFESVALGLVASAIKSETLKKQIIQYLFDYDLILQKDVEMNEVTLKCENIEWLPFVHPEIIKRKIEWLTNELKQGPELQRQRIIKILSLSYRKPVPEMAAWGILFGETLFVVRGNPDPFSSFLEYSQVVIIGPGWQKVKPQSLTKEVSRVSLMAITRCIEEAKFDLNRLEPEVGSWFVEGSGVDLYEAKDVNDFKETFRLVQKSGIPFASVSEDLNLIALQPGITGSYETLLSKLTAL